MTPVEVFDMAEVYYEKEYRKEKEEWKRFRWLAMHMINISQKMVKRPITEKQLLQFKDEIKKYDPEKRRKEAMETLRLHKQKFWTKLGGRDLKNIKIYGE